MTIRKKTIENSVRYVSKDNNLHSQQAPSTFKEIKIKTNTRKRNASHIKLSQNIKKFFINITGEGFRTIE